jgi:hypothetical protein
MNNSCNSKQSTVNQKKIAEKYVTVTEIQVNQNAKSII